MNKTLVWVFEKDQNPQWQKYVFCGWLTRSDEPGAVVERAGCPHWVSLDKLRLTDPFVYKAVFAFDKTREIL